MLKASIKNWPAASMTISETEPAVPAAESAAASARAQRLAMALTWSRLIAAPIVAGLIFTADAVVFTQGRDLTAGLLCGALVLFLVAAATDYFDGKIARAHKAITPFGAALDHGADKALTTAALMALAATNLPLDLAIAAAIIVTRDVVVACLREGMAQSGRALPVNQLGKVKTVVEMAAIALALLAQVLALWAPSDGAPSALDLPQAATMAARAGLVMAAGLALWSGWTYLRSALTPAMSEPAAPARNL